LKESPRNHTTAKHVFTKLGEATGTEYCEKSFLGYFKHQTTKEWQVLVQIYEKGNLYWAEQAKFI